VLVNIANDGWLDGGYGVASRQHFAMSVLRAVEARRYLVVPRRRVSRASSTHGADHSQRQRPESRPCSRLASVPSRHHPLRPVRRLVPACLHARSGRSRALAATSSEAPRPGRVACAHVELAATSALAPWSPSHIDAPA
jgi:hypothetical protein